MNHGSLFSGIGGFDLAAEWMGWNNMFHCEKQPFLRHVLKHYWPNSISYDDITSTDFTIWRGKIDILTGGFPCQPFSAAGKRKGKEDDRYLWPEMLRAINEIRPTWIVGENVAGIVSMVQPSVKETYMETEKHLFGEDNETETIINEYVVETICRDLEQIGYQVQPVIIPACAVGAPHRRDRIWFIAHTNSDGYQQREFGENRPAENQGESLQDKRQRIWNEHRGNGQQGIAADSDGQRCTEAGEYIVEAGDEWTQRVPIGGSVTDTDSSGRRERDVSYITNKPIFRGRPGDANGDPWENFPTQSPVRNGDDGVPPRLVSATVPSRAGRRALTPSAFYSRICNESLKAAGNAVVPQEVYEIFRSIQFASNE